MARPLRIEYAGALYHVTSRGDRREDIYRDDEDRLIWLEVFAQVCSRFNWRCHAWCQMDNHYHILVETVEGNLSLGMRQLNGVYTQASNRLHGRVGHVFQGRFKAILVDHNSYFLELSRYVVLNPVRAGMFARPEDWPWSSYLATLGSTPTPSWLITDKILAQFAGNRHKARLGYAQFVADGMGDVSIWQNLNQQIYLGDDEFVAGMLANDESTGEAIGVPKVQRRVPAPPLELLASGYATRDAGIVAAYATGEYSYQQIGQFYGLHFTSVGNIVRRARCREKTELG
jgi:putative transposase